MCKYHTIGLVLLSFLIACQGGQSNTQSEAESYYQLALEKASLGDHHTAVVYFTKAIELAPDSSIFYVDRANSKYELGDDQGTLEDIVKAVELDPERSSLHSRRTSTPCQ